MTQLLASWTRETTMSVAPKSRNQTQFQNSVSQKVRQQNGGMALTAQGQHVLNMVRLFLKAFSAEFPA